MFATVTTKPDQIVRFDVNPSINLIRDNVYPRNPYATGYGKKIPTPYRVRVMDNKWRRVYAVCYSNVSTLYVESKGQRYIVSW